MNTARRHLPDRVPTAFVNGRSNVQADAYLFEQIQLTLGTHPNVVRLTGDPGHLEMLLIEGAETLRRIRQAP